MANDNIVTGLPPGVTLDPTPHDAAPVTPVTPVTPQVTGLPAGVTLDSQPHDAPNNPKNWTPAQLETAKAASRTGNEVSATSTQPGVMQNLAEGFGKEAGKTMQGATELVNKVLPNSMQIPIPGGSQSVEPKGMAQNVGAGAEQATEFAGGEEALKSISSLLHVGKYAPEVLQLIEKYPTASKIILGAAKAGTVGAAQGTVKGAAEGNAGHGAETGAVGGAIGGAAAEAVPAVLPKIAKMLGVGGQTFESAMAKAGRPAVSDRNWKQSLETAKPLILDNIDPKSVGSVDEFVRQVHGVKQQVWNQVQQQIKDVGKGVFSANDVADKIRSDISPELREYFPDEAADMEAFASKFDKNMTIEQAHNAIELFNAKLKGFYTMSPEARAAVGKTDGDIAGLESAADHLREKMFDEIEARGQHVPRELRKQYGALTNIERVFTKRIPVADRQQELNLAQILSLAGGSLGAATTIASGHPLEAVAAAAPMAVATLAKARQAAPSMIRQGLKAGVKAVEPAAESVVGTLTKSAAGSAGSQAAQTVAPAAPESDGTEGLAK